MSEQTWEDKYVEVIGDERFKLFGFTIKDILNLKRIVDTYTTDRKIKTLEKKLK